MAGTEEKCIIYGTIGSEYTATVKHFLEKNEIPHEIKDARYVELWKNSGVIPSVYFPGGEWLNDSAQIIFTLSDQWSMCELNDMRKHAMRYRDQYLWGISTNIRHGMPQGKCGLWEFIVRLHSVGYSSSSPSIISIYFRIMISLNWWMRHHSIYLDPYVPDFLAPAKVLQMRDGMLMRLENAKKNSDDDTMRNHVNENIASITTTDNPWIAGNGITQKLRFGPSMEELNKSLSMWFYIAILFHFLFAPFNFFFLFILMIKRNFDHPMENDEDACLKWANAEEKKRA